MFEAHNGYEDDDQLSQKSGELIRASLLTIAFLLPLGFAWAQQDDRLNLMDPSVRFTSVERDYADLDARYARVGTELEISELRRMAIGQSQSDLQAVLGRFVVEHNDGSFEYHLSLPLTEVDRLICQYRVFFDAEDKVTSGVWRRPQCANLVLEQLQ